ncbi:MAG: branched-chain amino acid ABC transporter substrate-binding protein [Pseudomonadota bacterium]|jgi:branched-chain amino acid transport system substrate-binding protein|nr:branched-chain amino acid ABC transporter substrate-binding protein [Pseudomonadota bacterium]
MRKSRIAPLAFVLASAFAASAAAAETVKIAWIDPLTGFMAPVGQNQIRSWQYITELANKEAWAGKGITFEMVPFDGKLSTQESLTVLKSALDQGIRYVVQGNGSSVAVALADAVTKHNARNPGKEVVYLNYAAVDPVLTNERCSFWHFRIDINADMKMEALTTYMAKDASIKKVYLINQDYSFGHAVEKSAEEYLKHKRPDVEIVGKDRHPLAKVRDFSPYISKIRAAGADTVITGNWGSDLALMIKAAKDAGLNAKFYTYYAGTTGVPTAMGDAGADRVHVVANWIPNDPTTTGGDIVEGFLKKYDDDYYTAQTHAGIKMLAEGIKKAGSTDPVKVAFAMEGLKFTSLNGELEMRASDHQMQQPVFIGVWSKVNNSDVKYGQEKTGYGWKPVARLDSYVAAQPTSCQMERPAKP